MKTKIASREVKRDSSTENITRLRGATHDEHLSKAQETPFWGNCSLLTYLLAYLLISLRTYLPTNLFTYQPTYTLAQGQGFS